VFAYHGCLNEETKIGSDYRVDSKVKANLQQSAKTVNVSKLNPPIGGDVERVTIKMTEKRKK
jgi:dihydroneopterin aldolase